jgi:hypothetical protein
MFVPAVFAGVVLSASLASAPLAALLSRTSTDPDTEK